MFNSLFTQVKTLNYVPCYKTLSMKFTGHLHIRIRHYFGHTSRPAGQKSQTKKKPKEWESEEKIMNVS